MAETRHALKFKCARLLEWSDVTLEDRGNEGCACEEPKTCVYVQRHYTHYHPIVILSANIAPERSSSAPWRASCLAWREGAWPLTTTWP
jgi:hypothetical protein